MAAFLASYTGPTGQPRTVTIQANDIAEAKKLLRRRGIRIRELREASPAKTQTSKTDRALGKSWGSTEISLFDKAPSIKEKAVFANKLSALVDAGVPIVFHVGGTGELLDRNYFNNGLPVPPDFHGGEENFRSVDYMAIPVQPAQTLATMIFDGVFERFPDLRVGVVEQGAIWVPSWMRQMESAIDAFGRHEERLQKLSLRPSEYVRRQMKFTPYPTEDVGWIVEQAGSEVVLFSSDYPHVEGGRRPIERFERSLENCSDEVRQRFYHDNFDDLMGGRLGSLLAA